MSEGAREWARVLVTLSVPLEVSCWLAQPLHFASVSLLSFLTRRWPLHLRLSVWQEAATAVAVVAKEDEDDVSDKNSESDEGEADKDSPSERDEDSDKQSDTEVDEMGGDDEEVSGQNVTPSVIGVLEFSVWDWNGARVDSIIHSMNTGWHPDNYDVMFMHLFEGSNLKKNVFKKKKNIILIKGKS